MSLKNEQSTSGGIMKKEKKSVWGIILGILGALATLIGIVAYFFPNPWVGRQPQFKFTYEGTGKPVYEVAEGLAYSDATNPAILPFSVTVEVLQYSGNEYSGEMDVAIEWLDQDKNKQHEFVGKWENFRSQYRTPVKIELFPNKLFQYASLSAGISSYTWDTREPAKGYFDIVVRYNDNTELARETVTVVHTPWYHEVILDSAVVGLNLPVTAHVKVVNLGEPAKFKIIALIYDTTAPDITSITDDQSWWVDRTWTTTAYGTDKVTDTAIGTGKDYVTSFVIPAETFQEGHTYALGVTAFKELPYLKFANNGDTWDNSFERWRYRDYPIYLSIFVLK